MSGWLIVGLTATFVSGLFAGIVLTVWILGKKTTELRRREEYLDQREKELNLQSRALPVGHFKKPYLPPRAMP
jgi:hypothetical protein